MASSSSSTGCVKINDALYELYKPEASSMDIEIIAFHGLQSQNYKDAHRKAWILPGVSECWLKTWLPEEFPGAHIMSVSYDSSTEVSSSAGRMDMHLVGENLAQSIIGLEGIGQKCPVVLVGHCMGGLVLKEVCLQAEKLGDRHTGLNPYKTFIGNVRAIFFYSTPNSGSRLKIGWKQKGPLLEYLELLSENAARLNSSFALLRHQHGWKTRGVCEANETIHRRPISISRIFGGNPKYSHVVEEGSARWDVDDFCVLPGEDNFSICKPRNRRSSNYLYLVRLLQDVIQIEKLQRELWRSSLRLPQVFVDMPRRVDEVVQLLHLGKAEPSRVALVGMDGVGKTTLAKAVLIKIREKFDFTVFVEDVKRRMKSQNVNLLHLVAENLYCGSGRKVFLQDFDAQSLLLYLLGKKVLIIMDDVECEEQIGSILSSNWLGAGSRIIVTSRIRSPELMPTFSPWKVPFLSLKESEIMFLAHLDPALIRAIPKELIEKVIVQCEGLPLTLEVMGTYLRFEKKVSNWDSALEKLTKAESLYGIRNDRLWAKLKISFDDLAPLERNMFLDLAVFHQYDGWAGESDLEIWKSAWESGSDGTSVRSGLRNLVDRSFIDIDPESTWGGSGKSRASFDKPAIWIHAQLRALGKCISRPRGKRIQNCRGAWRQEDITRLLRQYKGDEAQTEVVWASLDQNTTIHEPYKWKSIAKLSELRLLRLSNVTMTGNESHRFPGNLAFLHLTSTSRHSAGIFDTLRSDYWPIREEDVDALHRLSVLCLDDCPVVRLPSKLHQLSNLKILIIRGKHLKILPEKFGRLSALKVLILENVGLSVLPDSFFHLSALQTLTLEGCSHIETGIFSRLSRWEESLNSTRPLRMLSNLKLKGLPKLTELPEAIWLLESLETLAIENCSGLEQLPEGLGKLTRLRRLEIKVCSRLESLCNSLGGLASLQSLRIMCCPRLCGLPDSVGQLQELESLSLSLLYKLQHLPEALGQLKSLKILSIAGCERLESFPETVGQLDELLLLQVISCYTLQRLPESVGQLKNLIILNTSFCVSSDRLPDSLGQLSKLQLLNLFGCKTLQNLPDSIGQLKKLLHLGLYGCISLQTLPDSLGLLEEISLSDTTGSPNLEAPSESSLQHLRALEELHLPCKLEPLPLQRLLTQTVQIVYKDESQVLEILGELS